MPSGQHHVLSHDHDGIVSLYPAGCDNCRMRDECESRGAFSGVEMRTVVDIDVAMTVTNIV